MILKSERAYLQGGGVPARGLLLEGGSGGAMLGLAPGHLFCQCCLILQPCITMSCMLQQSCAACSSMQAPGKDSTTALVHNASPQIRALGHTCCLNKRIDNRQAADVIRRVPMMPSAQHLSSPSMPCCEPVIYAIIGCDLNAKFYLQYFECDLHIRHCACQKQDEVSCN